MTVKKKPISWCKQFLHSYKNIPETESKHCEIEIRYDKKDRQCHQLSGLPSYCLLIILTFCFALLLGLIGIWIGVLGYSTDCGLPVDNLTFPTFAPAADTCTVIPATKRYDCWPQIEDATQTKCEAKGCCWLQFQNRLGDVPWCFYPSNYQLYNVVSLQKSDTGYSVKLQSNKLSGWPSDIQQLALDVVFETKTRLNFKLYDPNKQRYEVPIKLSRDTEPVTTSTTDYVVKIPSSGPFYIAVTRKSTGKILFSSKGAAPLVFSDQYIQIGTQLSSQYVYGLGEHRSRFQVSTNWTKLALWSRDQPPTRHANLYGVHPYYLNIEPDHNAHGVLLLNSNAMEIELQMAPALTYRATGGVLDFFVFSGPSPDNVVQQYTELIGRPFMPPYWALGFHLCRYGYNGTDVMKKVIQRMRAAKMPYDTQWNDIDYMRSYLDWTYDSNGRFLGLPDVVQDLHDHGQHYIMIVDPGISNVQPSGTYPPYDEGLKQDVFIKKPDGSGPIIGKVWPGTTAFPDFFHPNATSYWTRQVKAFHDQIPFDGLWTDMNEPSNFLVGSTSGCPDNTEENPPFLPAGLVGGTLRDKTLCASARQFLSTHYNLHSMYGHSEALATKSALDSILGNKRSIVISRSTFPSTGAHAGHWLGDNRAEWDDMYYSIPGMMSFQLFGIPLVGADICGFGGNTNPELCARWMQLGAWYPFMRNHNSIGREDQDPAVFDAATQKIMRDALEMRYLLLPYLYTLFYRSHVDGTPVIRPLFFQYPVSDYNVTYMEDVQFMWGSALLITPVTSQSTTQGLGYLPKDRWYDFYNNSYIDSPGHYITFDLPKEHTNVQVRGGSIIPMQTANVTTTLARKNKFILYVTMGTDSQASGELYWDDGESRDSIDGSKYNLIIFKAYKRALWSELKSSGYTAEPMILGQVYVLGVDIGPTSVIVNGGVVSHYTYSNQQETWSTYGLKTKIQRIHLTDKYVISLKHASACGKGLLAKY